MSLKLIYGRAKSKKGDTVFAEAAKTNGLIIVPEAYTLMAEKKLSEIIGTLGLTGPEVLSFRRLAHNNLDFGPLSEGAIDPCGKTIAVSLISEKVKKQLTVLKNGSEHTGFSENLLALISEFKQYAITPDMIKSVSDLTDQRILSSKLKDIALIYEKYNEFLSAGYTDRDDDLPKFCVLLAEKKLLADRYIYLDRFSGFTPIELNLIKEFMLQCACVTITLPCDPKSFEFQFLNSSGYAEKLKTFASENNIKIEEVYLESSFKTPELAHLEKNLFSFEGTPYCEKNENINLFSAKNINTESEYVARKIRKLISESSLRYSDISIIVRDTAPYSTALKSTFSSFGIPFTDTESISSSMHPLSVFVSSAIDTVCSSFTQDSLFKYLKSGFSPYCKEDVDKLENYMLATGLYGSEVADDKKWDYRTSVFSEYEISAKEKAEIEDIDRIRKEFFPPLLKLKSDLTGKINALTFSEALYSFFCEIHLPEKVNEIAESYNKSGRNDDASRLISVYNSIMDAMDSLIYASGDETLSASKFNSVFKDGISATTMSIIPSSADCVNFINAVRAKGTSSPIVFVMGLNDGVFPKVPTNEGLLSAADRIFLKDNNLELSPDSEHLNFEELFLLYSSFTAPCDKLFLSYALHDESGKTMFPSSIVAKIKEIFPEIPESTDILPLPFEELLSSPDATLTHMLDKLNRKALGQDIEDDWLKVYGWYINNYETKLPKIPNSLYSMKNTVNLSREITDVIFNEDATSGVSKLETYASCPFKYYMRYILHAEKRKIAEFSPADTGSILHRYIEHVSKYIAMNNTTWQKITENEIKNIAREVTSDILESSSYYLKSSKRALYLLKRLQNLSVKMLVVIKKHFECGNFEPLGSELVFGKDGDYPEITINTSSGNIKLTGKIDRADILHTERGDFLRIIDYKSGNKTFSLSEVYHGLNLQLSVYMLALNKNTSSKPAAMLYFKLDDPIDKTTASMISESAERMVSMNGVVLDDSEILVAMDKSSIEKSDIYDGYYATAENFDALFNHVKKVIGELYSEMKSGDVSVSPKSVQDKSPCSYCDYKSVCASNGECIALSDSETPDSFEAFYPKEDNEL